MLDYIILKMCFHVFTRELHFTADMVKLTINNCQWTVFRNMSMELLTLYIFSAPIYTLYWIIAALKPMIGGNIFKSRVIVLAIFTAVRSLWTVEILMELNITALEKA
ncbi:MAG: hypothetical protein MJE68_10415 [Proteobacteria bacterium]|nr:hypothetical protein [Pseudomonadota bacterium]